MNFKDYGKDFKRSDQKDMETIKAIVEAQLELTFDSVGDEFFLLDGVIGSNLLYGDITLEQTLKLEKINLELAHLLFEWMNQNNEHNPQYKVKVKK